MAAGFALILKYKGLGFSPDAWQPAFNLHIQTVSLRRLMPSAISGRPPYFRWAISSRKIVNAATLSYVPA
jgi:hypothetical protein